jgi:hypothetical protein
MLAKKTDLFFNSRCQENVRYTLCKNAKTPLCKTGIFTWIAILTGIFTTFIRVNFSLVLIIYMNISSAIHYENTTLWNTNDIKNCIVRYLNFGLVGPSKYKHVYLFQRGFKERNIPSLDPDSIAPFQQIR